MRPALATLGAALLGAFVATQLGCRDRKQSAASQKQPEPRAEQLEDLRAIPATVRFLVGVDAERARSSSLVGRALEQMFARDRALEARLDELFTMCAFDPMTDLVRLTMGLGSGEDEVVMVVAAALEENELASCLNRSVADMGGSLSTTPVDGRTFYRASRGAREVWFAFASRDRVAISPSEGFLRAALGRGPKVEDSEVLTPLLARVDRHKSAIWFVGQVPAGVGTALVDLTVGELTGPPTAFAGHIDLADGVEAMLEVAMAGPEDARAAVDRALPQLALSALSAQRYGLGPMVNKLRLDAEGSWFRMRIALGSQELNEALMQLDGREEEVDTERQSEQDSRRPSSEE